jgi:hypothetical protein
MEDFNTNGTEGLFQTSAPLEPQEGQQVQESTQDENFETWDKEKSVNAYKELQRKNTELDKLVKQLSNNSELENLKQEIAQVKNQFQKPEPTLTLPPKPIKPQKPANYEPIEAFTDSTSASYKYRLQEEEYRESIENYRDIKDQIEAMEKQKLFSSLQEVTRERQENLERQQKINGLIANGATKEEAEEILRMTTPTNPAEDVKNIIEYNRFLKNRGKPETKKQGVYSPAILPNMGSPTLGESNNFFKEIVGSDTSRLFQTKK